LSQIMLGAACVLLAYLTGSIPSGYIVARVRGVNIQQVGSGNIGVTNVLRAVGTVPAVLVAVADPLKGVLAALLPLWFGLGPWWAAACGLAVVLGNDYNVFLKFRGGKGIATSFGVLIVFSPVSALVSLFLGIYAIALSRFVSLGSLIGLATAPLLQLLLPGTEPAYTVLAFALALLGTWRHRDNIARLAAGNENRLGRKADPKLDRAEDVTPPG